VANSLCPKLAEETFAHGGATDYRSMFLVPLVSALGSALALALFFHPPPTPQPEAERAVAA
jgi:hypothetical protein